MGCMCGPVPAYATVRRIFDALVARGEDAGSIVDFVAGMTDRFALEYASGLGD